VVLEAPPGAGKSTGVPLALLDESWLARRRIVMLQPRRHCCPRAWRAGSRGLQVKPEPGGLVGYPHAPRHARRCPRRDVEVVTERHPDPAPAVRTRRSRTPGS
jgi:ATP-dependent helicase HrpB